MERRIINPWTWQDARGFVQGHEVSGPGRVLYCAGIVAVDAEGRPMHEGDVRAQALQALDNLETLLREAGYTLADLVRVNTYVTDIDDYFANGRPAIYERFAAAGTRFTATLLQVSRLALPQLLIEIEATAAA
jgi:enamine deaminase RidA (YjgF/YER057c/UK114 family)